MQLGADLHLTDNEGRTALHLGETHFHRPRLRPLPAAAGTGTPPAPQLNMPGLLAWMSKRARPATAAAL